MFELDDAMKVIADNIQKAQPIFGMIYKEKLEKTDEAIVTILATGPESKKKTFLPNYTDRSCRITWTRRHYFFLKLFRICSPT